MSVSPTAGKYHIGKNGVAVCKAEKRACRFLAAGHYDTEEEAEQAASGGRGTTETLSRGGQSDVATDDVATDDSVQGGDTPEVEESTEENTEPERAVYSFMQDFEERTKTFEVDFEGFPNRFFNADLVGKTVRFRSALYSGSAPTMTAPDGTEIPIPSVDRPALHRRLMYSTATPAEAKQLTREQVVELAEAQGLRATGEVFGARETRWFKSEGYWAQDKDGNVFGVAYSPVSSSVAMSSYYGGPNRKYMMTDSRTLLGANRIHRKTGVHMHELAAEKADTERDGHTYGPYVSSLKALGAVSEAQREGYQFLQQKQYVRNSNGSVATAWETKKGIKESHLEAMKRTSLKKDFRYVEFDDDTDLDKVAQFERDYAEIADKLPAIPKELQPELRIRKLGKHSSATSTVNGLFNAGRNSIAIDVRSSGSFIHEYGHFGDLILKKNASLGGEFREVTSAYSSAIKVPMGAKPEYYTTPTEVFARGFEMYMHERRGVQAGLLNPSKFSEFDYAPFSEVPGLKDKLFSFYDRAFAGMERKAAAK